MRSLSLSTMRSLLLLPMIFLCVNAKMFNFDVLEDIEFLLKHGDHHPLLWSTSKPIDFYIHPEASEAACLAGVNFWQENTCLFFIRKPSPLNGTGLHFINDDECYSLLGRQIGNQPQNISIGEGCHELGTVTHELGHALGFHHEHSRHNRDRYVYVNEEALLPEDKDDFERMEKTVFENVGVAYDYGSIMHYAPHELSANGYDLIQTLNKNYDMTIGQQKEPSFSDVKKMNLVYCNHVCPKELNCKFGGYVDPKNCSRCRCPDGFGGDFCETVVKHHDICGESNLNAKYKLQTLKAEGNVTCAYLITAPPNHRILLKLAEFSFSNQTVCDNDYVEIKYRKDISLTGARFCDPEFQHPDVITSHANQILVIYKGSTSSQTSKFSLQYQVDYESAVLAAIDAWQEKTCLTFQRKNSTFLGYGLHFEHFNGCRSIVGQSNWPVSQCICLPNTNKTNPTYNIKVIAQNIGHALGLINEHSRYDRHSYVSIEEENLSSYNETDFKRRELMESPFEDMEVGYDFGSIMHFDKVLINGTPTIQTLDQNYKDTIGQPLPSFKDIKRVNLAYCRRRCRMVIKECHHGGYQDVTNCSKCNCPDGLGGEQCETAAELSDQCGETNLTANSTFQAIQAEGGIKCAYLITAPSEHKVSFEITNFSFEKSDVCAVDYLEIKYGSDFSVTGARFCNDLPTVSLSETNQLLVIYSGHSYPNRGTQFSLKFRQVDYESAVLAAIDAWQEKTCLTFQRKNSTFLGYGLHFEHFNGCRSIVGQSNWPVSQCICLPNTNKTNPTYNIKVIAQNIGHALGLINEHSRYDRHSYVSIEEENLSSYNETDFKRRELMESPFEDMEVGYDFGSIMHFDKVLINGTPTIQTLDQNYKDTIGQPLPSFKDIKRVNLAYCRRRCRMVIKECHHGGYQDVTNCSKCNCPDGLGGEQCETAAELSDQCGETNLTANSTFQAIQAEGGIKCAYLITAPSEHKVSFEITNFSFEKSDVCAVDYLEIKYGSDFSVTGARFCNDLPTVSLSETNQLLVIYSGHSYPNRGTQFSLKFRQDPMVLTAAIETKEMGGEVRGKYAQQEMTARSDTEENWHPKKIN